MYEQFNTPVGRITYNIHVEQIKSKRKKSTTGINYKAMPNVSYHIAIQPKYRQNVVVSLRMNEKTPENISQ